MVDTLHEFLDVQGDSVGNVPLPVPDTGTLTVDLLGGIAATDTARIFRTAFEVTSAEQSKTVEVQYKGQTLQTYTAGRDEDLLVDLTENPHLVAAGKSYELKITGEPPFVRRHSIFYNMAGPRLLKQTYIEDRFPTGPYLPTIDELVANVDGNTEVHVAGAEYASYVDGVYYNDNGVPTMLFRASGSSLTTWKNAVTGVTHDTLPTNLNGTTSIACDGTYVYAKNTAGTTILERIHLATKVHDVLTLDSSFGVTNTVHSSLTAFGGFLYTHSKSDAYLRKINLTTGAVEVMPSYTPLSATYGAKPVLITTAEATPRNLLVFLNNNAAGLVWLDLDTGAWDSTTRSIDSPGNTTARQGCEIAAGIAYFWNGGNEGLVDFNSGAPIQAVVDLVGGSAPNSDVLYAVPTDFTASTDDMTYDAFCAGVLTTN